MSVCSVGTPTNPIPVCVTQLTIGSVSNFLTDVFVFFSDITTGRVQRFDVTTGAAGEVIIAPEDDFMPEHSYDVWVTLANAVDIETKRDLTVAGLVGTTDTVTLQFIYVQMDLAFSALTVTAQ